jgi:hypothetical protein
MPAAITHYLQSQKVLEEMKKENIQVQNNDAFLWGAQGPDFLFTHRYLPWQRGKSLCSWGGKIHREAPEPFFRALRNVCGQMPGSLMRSYAYGFLCHYSLDRTAHPYVYYWANFLKEKDPSEGLSVYHNEIESALDTIVLRNELGELPVDFPLTRTVPQDETVQKKMAELYQQVILSAYGKEVSEEDLYQATKDCRTAFRFLTDKTGLKRSFLRKIERSGKAITSHIRPIMEDENFDYANILLAPWSWEGAEGTGSFFDLVDQSVEDSMELIRHFFSTDDFHEFTEDRNFEGRVILSESD